MPETDLPRGGGASLRTELLFNLAFVAAAALLLALSTASVLRVSAGEGVPTLWVMVFLVAADVLVFLALGRYLIDRLVVLPLAAAARTAREIAQGAYEKRVPPARSREMQALVLAFNDLTDLLLHNQTRLAENIRSLNDTNRLLVATQRELLQAEKLASVGRLAAGIAHEIGNPLGALLGYVSLLKRGADPAEVMGGMEREAWRIDRIIRDVLQFARPQLAQREAVELPALIRQTIVLLEEQGRLQGIEVRLELPDDLPPVPGVPHSVEQVFVNLILNAADAMRDGGRLTVVARHERYEPARPLAPRRADDPPEIDYTHLRRLRYGTQRDSSRLEPGDEVVRVLVADSGPGILPAHIDTIFDPFFTTKPPGEGTGLGLAIVASTMAELGGRVDVTSAEGGGATFALVFPLAEKSA